MSFYGSLYPRIYEPLDERPHVMFCECEECLDLDCDEDA